MRMTENDIINTLETDIHIAERLKCSSIDVRVAILRNAVDLLYSQIGEIQKLKLKVKLGVQTEVQHGFWILVTEPDGKPYCYDCSVCANSSPYVGTGLMYKYCPRCGAKMDLRINK